jgi:hypothetical protein
MYHYSKNLLNVGDTIKSNQAASSTYKLFHKYYAEVYHELTELELPFNFGYAYPTPKTLNMNEYLVKSNNFIRGNFKYSIYAAMDMGYPSEIKRIKDLDEKKEAIKQHIKSLAHQYFKAEDNVELISDSFVVI